MKKNKNIKHLPKRGDLIKLSKKNLTRYSNPFSTAYLIPRNHNDLGIVLEYDPDRRKGSHYSFGTPTSVDIDNNFWRLPPVLVYWTKEKRKMWHFINEVDIIFSYEEKEEENKKAT